MAPSEQSLRLYKWGPGTGARPQDASVGRLSGVEPRETGEPCSSLILKRGWKVAVEANMNTQGAVTILFYFYHLALKTCNVKNLGVVYVFSLCVDQYTFFYNENANKIQTVVLQPISNAENRDLSSVGGRKWCKSTQVWGPSELVDLVWSESWKKRWNEWRSMLFCSCCPFSD